MARILYGVAGEGSGHSSRAKEIIEYLQSRGHLVTILSHSRGYKNLSPYFDVEKIFGLRFSYKNNRVQKLSTVLRNISKISEAAESINKVSKIVDEFKPQIVFSDFEPISCIVANIKKLPLISIDNQHRLTNTKIEYPKKYQQEAAAAKTVIRLMIFNSRACLVTSFFKTKIINKKTFLFPPILRKEVLEIKTNNKDYILVYLTSPFENLINILERINKEFVVYGFNPLRMNAADEISASGRGSTQNKKEKNIIFKEPSSKGFLKDLAGCEGVIANAGFTLITEALYLGKPYLALPVKGQFEQILNAYYLEKLGYGKYWDELDKEKIVSFLYNLNLYRQKLKRYKKEDNSKIFRKIDELINC